MSEIEIFAIPGLPEFRAGDDVAAQIAGACRQAGLHLVDGDVIVVAQKIISKAEGRMVALEDVTPSAESLQLAAETEKDPALVELILRESSRVLRRRTGTIIVEHRLGFVCANAGIDRSNVPQDAAGKNSVLLLPVDPDRSACALRDGIVTHLGVRPAVIVSDTHGRPFREGAVGVAIGVAGLLPVTSMIGWPDRQGRTLHTTQIATADELAAAASLLMGQSDEGRPVVVVRGARYQAGEGTLNDLLRARERDMFR